MLPPQLQNRLRLPVLVSPLFLVSGPDLVVASANAGVIGSFPALNQRSSERYEDWLRQIRASVHKGAAPFAVQFAIHRSNPRMAEDLQITIRHQVPILISTLGITREITDAVHGYGGLVFHDAVDVRHARKALGANVDGIIAVCGGAGGHAGTYNPFAFLGELRPLMQGKTLILAGCIGDGHGIAGAIAAGADLVYMGTRFVSTAESMASPAQKRMMLEAEIGDVIYTSEVSGIPGNFLRQTIPQRILGGAMMPQAFDVAKDLEPKRWRDIWSAGQGVGAIKDTPTTAALIGRLEQEYHQAVRRLERRAVTA